MRSSDPLLISPSRVARRFHLACDRYLRYSATPKARRRREGIPEPKSDHGLFTQTLLEGGHRWEERILNDHLGSAALIAPGEGALRDRVWSSHDTLRILRTAEPGQWIYQGTLAAGAAFRKSLGLDHPDFSFPDCRPDFLEVIHDDQGHRRFRIHDAKASAEQKLGHRVQVTLYGLILESILQEEQIDGSVDDSGGVWIAGESCSGLFDCSRVRGSVEQFLKTELPRVLTGDHRKVFWHVSPPCQGCEWIETCRAEAIAERTLSLLPGLTRHGHRYLANLVPPVRDLDSLRVLLDRSDGDQVLEPVASLSGRRHRLRTQLRALEQGQMFPIAGSHLGLPRFEHVRFVITAQVDPVSGEPYALGWRRSGGKDLFESEDRESVSVAKSDDAATRRATAREFVRSLYEQFQRIDRFNQARQMHDRLTLLACSLDQREGLAVIEVFRSLADDLEVGTAALDLFFCFQTPDLLDAEERPETTAHFAVAPVVETVRSVVALPTPFSPRLSDLTSLLAPSTYPFHYEERGLYSQPFSHAMKPDAIYGAWHREKVSWIAGIERELVRRMKSTDSVIRGFRERVERHPKTQLVARSEPFSLPRPIALADGTLSKLVFMARHECALGALESRRRRVLPLPERLERGVAQRLVSVFDRQFRAAQPVDDEWIDPFPRFLLTTLDDAGEAAHMTFDDLRHRANRRPPRGGALAGVSWVSADRKELRLDIFPGRDFPGALPGREYLLQPRFTDWNSQALIQELGALDAASAATGEVPLISRLVTEPASAQGTNPDAEALGRVVRHHAEVVGFTPSQRRALEGVLHRRIQLVWGPPGTGKTWFLAHTILALARAHADADRPFRVWVTAFTHAAIDNLLGRIQSLQETNGGAPIIPVAKINRHEDLNRTIPSISQEGAQDWISHRPRAVVGSTIWRTRKALPTESRSVIDLLVMDEASQVRVAEAAVALRYIRPSARITMAGDDRQLPPIVAADWPDPAPTSPLLHRSIFEAIRWRDPEGDLVTPLLEDFRLCAELCEYPAARLYVPDYRPANSAVAGRRLNYQATPHHGPFATRALDPRNPLVVVVLRGVRAGAENALEADHVAQCALAFRDGGDLPDDPGHDQEFWSDHLFIVTPHHAQRRAVVRRLTEARSWGHRPFVDTVDKMQGQEADAVLVSYGVSDVELALQESDFIYSTQRLNVALTRARSKCVIFLPEPLLSPDLEAFEDPRVAEGISFMQGLLHAAGDVIYVDAPSAAHGR